jgi:tetratricopeptide (TPR) repeat protein
LTAPDPLERAAAVHLLGGADTPRDQLRPLLRDPVRLVRLEAEWALSAELRPESPERRELDSYLKVSADQPSGRLRLGQDRANRGDLPGAEAEVRQAIAWDGLSPALPETLGMILHAEGRTGDAANAWATAAQLAPSDANLAYRAALAYAEVKQWPEAEAAFRLAVQRNPTFDRAWYNLGLLLAQAKRGSEAAEALRRAEEIAPHEAAYPYALATVLFQAGDRAGAAQAAERALAIDPAHAGAQELLRRVRSR